MTRGFSGTLAPSHRYNLNDISIKTVDPDLLGKSKAYIVGKLKALFGWFYVFETYVSGVIGIYAGYRIAALIFGFLIRTVTLYRVFGANWKLIGCFATSFANCLYTLDEKERNK